MRWDDDQLDSLRYMMGLPKLEEKPISTGFLRSSFKPEPKIVYRGYGLNFKGERDIVYRIDEEGVIEPMFKKLTG